MDDTAITTQPLRTSVNSDKPAEPSTELNGDTGHKENGELNEVTAVFNPEGGQNEEKELSEEEKEKRRQRQEEITDCCCVYTDDSDAFCLYMLCHWICDCFRGIGHCTEECFEGCASCLSECCEGEGGCIDCCCNCDNGGDIAAGATDGDDLAGCLDCCTSCDCDCSS